MTNPIFAFFLAYDRAIERICDAAFRSAAASGEPREIPELTPREQVLVDFNEGRDIASSEGLEPALYSGLLEKEGDGYVMTALGRYVFPMGYELRSREAERAKSPAAAGRP